MSQYRDATPGTPDSETFSTPPSTPGPTMSETTFVQTSLSRMPNKLASLHIDHKPSDWTPNIELQISPDDTRKANGVPSPAPLLRDLTAVPHGAKPPAPHHHHLPPPSPSKLPVNSPCFVHSHLDKSAHLTDWLKNKHSTENHDVGVARSLQLPPAATASPAAAGLSNANGHGYGYGAGLSDDEDEFHGSLTKRLAETAVGVREMSKQLGRARVQSNIQNVLIVTKARDNRLIKLTRELALYLMLKHRRGSKRGLVVYVDSQLRKSRRFDAEGIERDYPALFEPFPRRRTSSNQSSNHSVSSLSSTSTHREESDEGQLRYWTSSMCNHSPHLFDFVVTLGGDGTVLFTSWLFQRIVPPVLPFALGSLGFLTNFDFADHQAVMDSAIDNGIRVNLRMRFTCTVYRSVANEEGKGRKAVKMGETGEIMMKNIEKGGWEALEGGWTGGYSMGDMGKKDKEIMCFTTRPAETFEVLNDLVVDRGQNPYVSLLELFGDEHHMTTVQADGLTVSTPTGSTAYSLSAGGSLVHPEIPAILVTPICPHTLSFRPILLPDSMELRICVPYNSRSTAWASFDGRGRVELKHGDHIKVTASKYPFPTVCADKQSTDWFHAISRTLKWNERERQKSFVVVEEGPPKRHRAPANKPKPSVQAMAQEESPEVDEEDEVSDYEAEEGEEDDKFDIDDSSPEAETTKSGSGNGNAKEDTLIPDPSVLTKRRTKSRSRSRVRGTPLHSGVNSPSRFAGGQTPQHSPGSVPGSGPSAGPGGSSAAGRHVDFDIPVSGPSSGTSSPASLVSHAAQQGVRDELHVPRSTNGRSRIPKDRDLDLESVKTPTPAAPHHRHSRSRSRDPGHRAFAVWGHDESDSNASDNESQ